MVFSFILGQSRLPENVRKSSEGIDFGQYSFKPVESDLGSLVGGGTRGSKSVPTWKKHYVKASGQQRQILSSIGYKNPTTVSTRKNTWAGGNSFHKAERTLAILNSLQTCFA